jgi:hypothetical protein
MTAMIELIQKLILFFPVVSFVAPPVNVKKMHTA